MNNDEDASAMIAKAREALINAKEKNAGLLILTGAGMSVSSGVPVFRHGDGTMSQDFTNFLKGYNEAREANDLKPADDWFDFSVPKMFDPRTETPAWAYWRWRILRAKVAPGEDYQLLDRIISEFGIDNTFVVTSNCDGLHVQEPSSSTTTKPAGVPKESILEIHGSLSRVQCSKPCSKDLYPADEDFCQKLETDEWKVPRCNNCSRCLRPNVMIFGDDALVNDVIETQSTRQRNFLLELGDNYIALEIGAGLVVPSIRYMAEQYGENSRYGLIRINPSENCLNDADIEDEDKYFPIAMTSTEALEQLEPSKWLLSSSGHCGEDEPPSKKK